MKDMRFPDSTDFIFIKILVLEHIVVSDSLFLVFYDNILRGLLPKTSENETRTT